MCLLLTHSRVGYACVYARVLVGLVKLVDWVKSVDLGIAEKPV